MAIGGKPHSPSVIAFHFRYSPVTPQVGPYDFGMFRMATPRRDVVVPVAYLTVNAPIRNDTNCLVATSRMRRSD